MEDCRVGVEAKEGVTGSPAYDGGWAPHAFDAEAEKKLWCVNCEMIGPLVLRRTRL